MRLPVLATSALITAALALPLAAPAFAAPLTHAPVVSATSHGPRSLDISAIQQALDAITAAGAPGVIAEVRDAHAGVWNSSSGTAGLERPQKLRVGGLFRAGSVTKTFTATTALQLVAEKKVSLDAPVERYLPGLVPNGKKITVRQLLNHRSGLAGYTDTLWPGGFGEMYASRFKSWTPQQLVAESAAHEPYFAPGADGHYSNTNFVLLGMLIEKVTGNSAEHEMTERILKPLGLQRSYFSGDTIRIHGLHARGYMHLDGPDSTCTDFTDTNLSWASTAGTLVSTTHDLSSFFKALIGGRLLPARLLGQMKAMQSLDDGSSYGLGLSRKDDPAYGTAYGHIGAATAFKTYSFTTADNSRQVTFSVNTLADTVKMRDAVNDALTALLSAGRKA
ncbi:serine hydrolase domain-containing protein [Streptomyces sp. NPDC002265]|uniref:serine hydrolase domain-containing protein n=1 Tax=Streptomyces sp. NPDC002265 TaxID=3154415 RepID=UPI00332D8202